jgi:hypothetical protein
MLSMNDAKAQLRNLPADAKLARIAVPMQVGFASNAISAIKSYLILKGFDFTLTHTGGWMFKDYVLTVRDITAKQALTIIATLDSL